MEILYIFFYFISISFIIFRYKAVNFNKVDNLFNKQNFKICCIFVYLIVKFLNYYLWRKIGISNAVVHIQGTVHKIILFYFNYIQNYALMLIYTFKTIDIASCFIESTIKIKPWWRFLRKTCLLHYITLHPGLTRMMTQLGFNWQIESK